MFGYAVLVWTLAWGPVVRAGSSARPLEPETIAEAFPPPTGFAREEGGSFSAWLGGLRLASRDVAVRTHDGHVVGHHARVIELPMVSGDLQQCADTLIRLRATWLREQGRSVSFHATSGDDMPWSRVQGGEVPYEEGGSIRWRPGTVSFEGYLRRVFIWAGTASLARYDTAPSPGIAPGDLLVSPGYPGHAVQVLDVAMRGEDVRILVAEGYMPAQNAHVELGPHDGWWAWDDGLDLTHWTFTDDALRRWK